MKLKEIIFVWSPSIKGIVLGYKTDVKVVHTDQLIPNWKIEFQLSNFETG